MDNITNNFILNEVSFAKALVDNRIFCEKPSEALSILARYYRQKYKLSVRNTETQLAEYIESHYPATVFRVMDTTLSRYSRSACKRPLLQADYIPITKDEMEHIINIKSKRLERLAFVLLALAKYHDAKNIANDGWVNQSRSQIFKLARISASVSEQCELLRKLRDLELISYRKQVNKLNIKVLYINNSSPLLIQLTDYRELGYEYLLWRGEKISRCSSCGKLIRKKKCSNRKYCDTCRGYTPASVKLICCSDCGKEFFVNHTVRNKRRCDSCQTAHRRETDRIRKSNSAF